MDEDKSQKFEAIVEKLNQSETEEDIIEYLTRIVKGFSVDTYRDRILSNPYFKSLISDVKSNIQLEIKSIRESIKEEIEAIDVELRNSESEYSGKLRELRRECLSLLHELDQKEKDIKVL